MTTQWVEYGRDKQGELWCRLHIEESVTSPVTGKTYPPWVTGWRRVDDVKRAVEQLKELMEE